MKEWRNMENDTKLLASLCEVLRHTDELADLQSLTYLPHEDEVVARFDNRRKLIKVTALSGLSLIKEVINKL